MKYRAYKGFTIVELLIVIVVIAILATIAIVSYNGIKSRAQESTVVGDLSGYAKLIENSRTTNASGTYPLDLQSTSLSAQAQSSIYGYDATPTGTAYCIEKRINNSKPYSASSEKNSPSAGGCGSGIDTAIAWWPLNGDVQDKSGNGLHGQPTNVTNAANAYGIASKSMAFNGTSSSINCTTNTLLQPSIATPFSVSATIYVTAYPSSRAGIVSSGSGGWALSILNNGTLKMDMGNKNIQGLNVPLNTWVHASMYYDPSNGDYGRYGLRATVLGASNSSNTFSEDVAPTTLTYGATPCYIGSYRNDNGTFFNGSIDDVRVCGPYNGSIVFSCTASGL